MGVGGGKVGVGDAGLGPGGEQVAAQDFWPGAGAPVEDPSPAPRPALPWALLVHLQCSQAHCFSCRGGCIRWGFGGGGVVGSQRQARRTSLGPPCAPAVP